MKRQGVPGESEAHEVASFGLAKTRRFFRLLKEHPFLAIVVDDDDCVHVYAREDIDHDDLAVMLNALQTMIEESQA